MTAHRAGRSKAAAAAAPQVVLHTLTRIVGVVPAPLRWLLVALAVLALGLAVRSRLTAGRARRLERQRRDLLDDVGLLQAALLPVVPRHLGGAEVSVAYRPADGPAAGGDFYDVFELEDGRVGIIIGDLSGHGRRALPHTSLVRFTLRAHLEAGLSPRQAIQGAAPPLERQLGDSFATVVIATFDPRSRQLVFASAGHPSPLIVGPPALEPITVCCSPPIGLGMPTGLRQTTVELPGQAVACFYTDGLVEARRAGKLLGAARLGQILADLDPAPSAEALLAAIAAHTDARPDDMAACIVAVNGEAHPPRIVVEELEILDPGLSDSQIGGFLAACGVGRGAVRGATHEALRNWGRDRGVLIEVRWELDEPAVTVRASERSLFHRAALRRREQRRMTG